MVSYFDLDHLKYINDTFGHKEGGGTFAAGGRVDVPAEEAASQS